MRSGGPLRAPRAAAWEGHSLSVLTGGRYDFWIGTGRPDLKRFAEALGRPWGSASDRLQLVAESIEHLRDRLEIADGAVRGPGDATIPLGKLGPARGRFEKAVPSFSFGAALSMVCVEPASREPARPANATLIAVTILVTSTPRLHQDRTSTS